MKTTREFRPVRQEQPEGLLGGKAVMKTTREFRPVTFGPTLARMSGGSATVDDDGQVELKWKTGYEVDNLGFNIYRRLDPVQRRPVVAVCIDDVSERRLPGPDGRQPWRGDAKVAE